MAQDDECSAINPMGCAAEVKGDVFLDFLEKRATSWSGGDGLVVPLQRTKVVRTNGSKSDHELFYYIGNITVGYPPQKMSVLLDTASGNIILPHRICKSRACKAHKAYSSWSSTTSEDVWSNGTRVRKNQRLVKGKCMRENVKMSYTSADLGDGFVRGPYVKDRVCIADAFGQKVCSNPIIVAALSMDDVPFTDMPSDGILGLAMGGEISVKKGFNFLQSLTTSKKLKSQFAITFGNNGGELHIGGYNPSLIANPLQWFPVHEPGQGYWQVPILSVRVGNKVVDSCVNGCHAIVDTGTSRIGVQKGHLPNVRSALSAGLQRKPDNGCQGPKLTFDLGGMSVDLSPDDYADDKCETDLGPLDLEEPEYYGVYTFGEMVLRHYFVVCDWKEMRMGFAPLKAAFGGHTEQTFI